MFAEHIPKINLGLGLVIIICFFLPWVSVDCGSVSVVKLSGYHLTTGNIPLDEHSLAALGEKLGGGKITANEGTEPLQKGHPQYYLIFVVIAALGVVLYSLQGMRAYSRVKSLSVAVFAALGLVGVIVSALLDFGLGIPAEAAMMIKTSYQAGFYGSVLSFLGVIALSFLWLKSAHEVPAQALPSELANLVVEAPEAVAIEEQPSWEESTPPAPEEPPAAGSAPASSPFPDLGTFGEAAKKPSETGPPGEKAPAPEPAGTDKQSSSKEQTIKLPLGIQPATRTCPTCGAVVGPFQTKCIRCGAKLKAGS